MKRRQFATPPAPRPAPSSPAAPEVLARRERARREYRLAYVLKRWAGVRVPDGYRHPSGAAHWAPEKSGAFLAMIKEQVRRRAAELVGLPVEEPPPAVGLAELLAQRLDGRFVDAQRLTAAVIAIETGMAPHKALRRVLARVVPAPRP